MTRLLTDSNSLFLHIPRTGGTYVEQVLFALKLRKKWNRQARNRLPVNHTLLSHYPPERLTGIETVFTFVRHPIPYYQSAWRWFHMYYPESMGILRWNWHPHRILAEQYVPDFNLWVQRMIACHPGWYTRMLEGYVGPQGGEFCQFIGRTENLQQNLLTVLKVLGYSELIKEKKEQLRQIPKINTSKRVPITWDPQLKQTVLEQENEAIQRFWGPNTHDRYFYASWRRKKLRPSLC